MTKMLPLGDTCPGCQHPFQGHSIDGCACGCGMKVIDAGRPLSGDELAALLQWSP